MKSRLSINKNAGWVCLCLLLVFGQGVTQAATVWFEPPMSAGVPGDILSVAIVGDFEDGIFSGNLDVRFDPAFINAVGSTVDNAWGVANNGFIDNAVGMISGIEFAKEDVFSCFPFCSGFGPGSNRALASVEFELTGQVGDVSPLTLSTDAGSINFAFTDQDLLAFTPSFNPGTISLVPLPAAFWLVLSSLVLLALLGRRYPSPSLAGADGLTAQA